MDIIVKNLNKSFGSMKVLDDVTITIKSGQVFSLVGPNGAGKTTLLRILLNLYNGDSGTVFIDDVDVNTKEFNNVRSKIGFVLDNIGLFKDLTAEENLEFFHRIYKGKYPKKKRRIEIDELLKLVELYDHRKKKIIFFSRGMKQRLAIARSLINDPKLILLDEPLRGLDLEGKFAVREIIHKLSSRNCTVFINSHDLDEVERCSDQVAFISKGKIVEVGTLDELRNQYSLLSYKVVVSEIGEWISELNEEEDVSSYKVDGNEITLYLSDEKFDVFNWFSSKKIKVEEIKKSKKNLEDIYIDVIGG